MTWNHTFSPTILNEFRFGFNRSVTYRLSETSFTRDYAKEVFNLKNIATAADRLRRAGVQSRHFQRGRLDLAGDRRHRRESCSSPTTSASSAASTTCATGFQISRQAYFQVTNFNGNPTLYFRWPLYRHCRPRSGTGLADFLLGIPASAGGAVGDGQQDMRSTLLRRVSAGRLAHPAELHHQHRPALRVRPLARGDQQPQPLLQHRTAEGGAGGPRRPARHRRPRLQQLGSALRLQLESRNS